MQWEDGIAVSVNLAISTEIIAAFCRRWKIERLSLFGSVLRDDFNADSDVVSLSFLKGRLPVSISYRIRPSE